MFYGDDASVIIGKDIALLLAQTRGRHNFVPPAISDTVGKKCTVTALVKDETYDAEEEGLIIFEVKKAELITYPSLTETSSKQPATPASKETSTMTATPAGIPRIPESPTGPENTPTKNIVDQTGSKIEDDRSSQADDKKRKSEASTITESKKQSTGSSKGNRPTEKLSLTAISELLPC